MSLFGRSREKMKHVRGLLRVFGYFTVIGVGASFCSLRAAHAEVKTNTLQVGRQMAELARGNQAEVNRLTINGQSMYVGSALADDSMKDVLDRYEAHCRANPGQPASAWRELSSKPGGEKLKDTPFGSNGVMRTEQGDEGTVVCFTKGDDTKPTALEALKSFADTGELGALGKLRYVYVKKTDRGSTLVLTAWTESKFNLAELTPEEGKDVAGSDFEHAPRYPGSTRVLATRLDGTPYGVNVYKTGANVGEVLGFYDTEMKKNGWFGFDPTELVKEDPDHKRGEGRLYEKDGVVLTIGAHVEPDNGTFVSLGLAGTTAGKGLDAKSSL